MRTLVGCEEVDGGDVIESFRCWEKSDVFGRREEGIARSASGTFVVGTPGLVEIYRIHIDTELTLILVMKLERQS